MTFSFITAGGNKATLGKFQKLHPDDLKLLVKQFPIHWITA